MLRVISFSFLALTAQLATVGTTAHAQTAARDSLIQAGTYDLSITYGGGLLEATLELAYVRDSLTAVLKLGDHQSPVKAGAHRGNKLTLEPQSAGMDVRYELEFSGPSVKGTFTYQGQAGTVTGKRRAAR